ncbi:hypothetical protein PIB30_075252 [Stylosanthes scabra]|uniref:Uncharacterized protein n=1 Tax=Stylosanthes scabra TaxID=79078 RepID=A0ABU6XRR6_9FABA|nr:hypothetical protein [Stylosanthes scabra]
MALAGAKDFVLPYFGFLLCAVDLIPSNCALAVRFWCLGLPLTMLISPFFRPIRTGSRIRPPTRAFVVRWLPPVRDTAPSSAAAAERVRSLSTCRGMRVLLLCHTISIVVASIALEIALFLFIFFVWSWITNYLHIGTCTQIVTDQVLRPSFEKPWRWALQVTRDVDMAFWF